MKNPEPPGSKHKKLHVTKNRKTWFDERQKAKTFGCAWPSKKLPRGNHAEVTPIPPLPARILKLSAQHITPTITKICNHSIKSNISPQQWKTGILSPLFKKGATDDPGNYRPISVLPFSRKCC